MNLFYRIYIPLIIFGYPLISLLPLWFGVESRLFTIPFRLLILTIAIFIIIKFKNYLFSINIKIFYLFWLIYLFRIIWDFNFNQSNLRLELYEYISYSFLMCMIPALAFGLILVCGGQDEKLLRRLSYFGLIAIVLNIAELVRINAIDFNSLFTGRLETVTLNAVSLSSLGYTFSILSSIILIKNKNILLCLFFVLLGIMFGLSGGSRGPAIAFFIAYFVCFIKFVFIAPNRNFKLLTLLLILIIGLFIILVNYSEISVISRFNNVDPSDNIRLYLMSSGLSLYFENFILGSGIEPLGFYPHNIILEAFLVCGLFSGIPFLILILNAIIKSYKLFHNSNYFFWTIPLFIYTLIIGMVNGSLYQDYVFWCLISFFMMTRSYHTKYK